MEQQRRVLAIEGKITGSKPRDHFLYGWAFSLLCPSRCTCLVPQNNVRTPRHLDASLRTGNTKLQVQKSARKLIKSKLFFLPSSNPSKPASTQPPGITRTLPVLPPCNTTQRAGIKRAPYMIRCGGERQWGNYSKGRRRLSRVLRKICTVKSIVKSFRV